MDCIRILISIIVIFYVNITYRIQKKYQQKSESKQKISGTSNIFRVSNVNKNKRF